MGEHTEDMAKDWNIGRREQDELALEGHRRAIAAHDGGLYADLNVPNDGTSKDHFPRRDTSLEKLAKLKPVFDRASGRGTLTAGNSSPLTDGAAGVWVATETGLARLPPTLPRARLVDYEIAAVDLFHEGLLMAPVAAIPRLLARHGLKVELKRVSAGSVDVPAAIRSQAAETGVDFMVMGGYGHSRLREFILGGVTRRVLEHATVPLMMHR